MILFATEDAGPAQYLSQIIPGLDDYVCVGSSVSKRIFETYNIKCLDKFDAMESCDLIVTGTHFCGGLDMQFIKTALEKKIPVVSIVEHWSWYLQRFTDENGQQCFPNYIIVNDDFAEQEAIKEGLPKNIIKVLGNPVFENYQKKQLTPESKEEWLSSFSFLNKPVITLVSENNNKTFSKNTPYYLGFDEFDVIEDILSVIKNDFNLVIKLHPSEEMNKYVRYARENVFEIKEGNMDSLITHSDFFIGMGSMLLLEAAQFRQDVISYRPDEKKKFFGNELSVTYLIKNKHDLRQILQREKNVKNKVFKNQFSGSKNRIKNFIENCALKGMLS